MANPRVPGFAPSAICRLGQIRKMRIWTARLASGPKGVRGSSRASTNKSSIGPRSGDRLQPVIHPTPSANSFSPRREKDLQRTK